MNLKEYLELNDKYRLKYDFWLEPSNVDCDRKPLTLEIYENSTTLKNIGNIYNCGDTMNTYKQKIIQDKVFFPDKCFDLSNRKRRCFNNLKDKKKVLSIIKETSFVNNDHTFYKDNFLCNNYQIGNFIPIPTKTIGRKSINVARSYAPNYDIFSKYLENIYYYYSGDILKINGNMRNVILLNKEYYNQFKTFDNYIINNHLQDYFNKDTPIDLYKMTFDEYCYTINILIKKRGLRILSML